MSLPTTSGDDGPPSGGDGRALADGVVLVEDDTPHGRTLLGTDRAGEHLFVLVADGYDPQRSLGLGRREAALALAEAGAFAAIFVDGGGSSTLVARETAAEYVVVSHPAGLQKIPGTRKLLGQDAIEDIFNNGNRSMPRPQS